MEFSLPPGSVPHDVAVDSHGIVWVSEAIGGTLGRFDPNSLTYTRITPPPGKNSKCELNAVAVDPQGQVWVADDGPNARLLQYDPKSLKFTSYPIPDYPWPVPDSGGARIGTLRFLDGNVWGTRLTAQRILKLTPATGKTVEYPVPRGSAPLGMAVGTDHTIWYTGEVANTIVRLDPTTGQLTDHDAPALRSELKGMAADAAGNLWAAASQRGKLLRLGSRTGVIAEFAPPTEDSGPYSVDVDTARNLIWFSEAFTDRIVRFDPASKTFLEFPIPSPGSNVQRIEIDRSRPNRVWWAGARTDTIGYVEVMQEENQR
jgi:virginiamycin B lyase